MAFGFTHRPLYAVHYVLLQRLYIRTSSSQSTSVRNARAPSKGHENIETLHETPWRNERTKGKIRDSLKSRCRLELRTVGIAFVAAREKTLKITTFLHISVPRDRERERERERRETFARRSHALKAEVLARGSRDRKRKRATPGRPLHCRLCLMYGL
uniref:Uncharacterized protein n=1 Tax=Trichogramma kaykai TaxID=54128 RepID=A0ABD2W6Q6_9HYME